VSRGDVLIKEFREFIERGNLIDIAVGFALGAAFTAVVTTFTERIVNPAIGLVFDLDDLSALGTFGENGSLGAFLGSVLNFLIVGLFLFFVVKAYNRFRAMEEAAAEPTEEVVLLTEIRDALAAR
jgi:large conductance mechanosensitive channel